MKHLDFRATAALVLLFGAAACTDPFGPDSSAPIDIQGVRASDTIRAIIESGITIGTSVEEGVQAYVGALWVPCPPLPTDCSSMGVRPADAEYGFDRELEMVPRTGARNRRYRVLRAMG